MVGEWSESNSLANNGDIHDFARLERRAACALRGRRLYQLQPFTAADQFRRTAGRNLSTNEWNTFLPGQPYFEVFPGLPIPKD